MREGWQLKPEDRGRISVRLLRAVLDPRSKDRTMLGAAKILVGSDLRQQEIDLKRQILDGDPDAFSMEQLVDDAERRATQGPSDESPEPLL
jgi:hypothetical protein